MTAARNFAGNYESGVDLGIPSQLAVSAYLIDPKAKTRSRLHYQMASLQAARMGNVWPVMLDTDGFLTEGTGWNLFLVRGGKIYSPEPRNILLGVTRRVTIELADKLGIAHYVFDHVSRFRDSVIDQFADDYANGRTPIPCVQCNMGVKFTDLLSLARDLGADCLATGHYVRREMGAGGAELHRAADPARDQSYFLFATTRDQLDYLRFPLGAMPKAEVRELAREVALPVAAKPDSQDICFVPDGDYARIVRKLRPEAGEEGAIVDLSGRELGRHKGIIHYTVGQRRGLEQFTGPGTAQLDRLADGAGDG